MTTNQEKISVNLPSIVSETIDGEVVIVNLLKGDYYSLFNTAADIWSLIEQGTTRSNIAQTMQLNYDCSDVDLAAEVDRFVTKLDEEGLIATSTEQELSDPPNPSAPTQQPQSKFQLPAIEKFTDMEELLLLDPIHEADEDKGWPNAKQTA
ncbi:MAG: PqqD family protein [Cyanobacteria bacterium J06643_13]